jgi:AraC family transcriptional regulator, transcriptional activator of pobA
MADSIKKYKFRSGVKLEVEVISLEALVRENKSLLTIPHRTDFYHVFLFENCSPRHMVDFEPIKTTNGTALFLDKGRVHQFDPDLKYKGRVLIFTDDFFCSTEGDAKFLRGATLFNDISGRLDFKPGAPIFKKFKNIYDAIHEELGSAPDQVKHGLLKNMVHNVLLLIEREKGQQNLTGNKKPVELNLTILFKDLLEKNFLGLKKVHEYATRLNISEKRLGQSTAKVLGKSPKEMIDERVLLEAKRLLIHANVSVKEIGFQLGFEEPTNFIKYFRKHTSNTPAEFRERHLSALSS